MDIKIFRKFFFALILGALLLTGCMDVNQQLWINSDGSGRMVLDIGITESGFSKAQSGTEALIYINMTLDKYQESLKKNALVKNLVTRQYSQEEIQHRVIEFDVTDFETYFEGVQKYDDPFTVRLETLENGEFRFTEKIIPGGAEWLEYYYDYFNFRPNPSQLDTLFSNQGWRVQLFAPKIISSNGVIDPQTGATTWEVPLEEIIKLKEGKSLNAIYQTTESTLSKPWFPYALGIVVFLGVFVSGILLLGLIIFFGFMRNRNQTKSK